MWGKPEAMFTTPKSAFFGVVCGMFTIPSNGRFTIGITIPSPGGPWSGRHRRRGSRSNENWKAPAFCGGFSRPVMDVLRGNILENKVLICSNPCLNWGRDRNIYPLDKALNRAEATSKSWCSMPKSAKYPLWFKMFLFLTEHIVHVPSRTYLGLSQRDGFQQGIPMVSLKKAQRPRGWYQRVVARIRHTFQIISEITPEHFTCQRVKVSRLTVFIHFGAIFSTTLWQFVGVSRAVH